MPRSRAPSAVPPAIRRQLDLAAAAARERIKEVHRSYATEFIEHAGGEIKPKRALDIYARLHKLSEAEGQAIAREVFVTLGRRALPERVGEAQPGAEEAPWGAPESVLRQIRRRIRGRVNAELREWVEHHTGRAETALLWTHVENAHQFIDLLAPVRSAAAAVALYADMLGLPPSRTEIVYFLVLDQRGSIDATRRRSSTASAHRSRPPADRRRLSLRVVNKRAAPGRQQTG